MRAFIGLIVVFLILQAVLLGVSVGVGLSLHWMMPSVEVGISILVGVISTFGTAYFFVLTMENASNPKYLFPLDEIESDDEVDDLYEEDRGSTRRKSRLAAPKWVGRTRQKKNR